MDIYKIFLISLITFVHCASASEIYKWKDEQGVVHFSDGHQPERPDTAESVDASESNIIGGNDCKSLAMLAKNIMTQRQKSEKLPKMLDLSVPPQRDTTTILTFRAYDRPFYSTMEYKASAIERFETDVYMDCMKDNDLIRQIESGEYK